MNGYKKHGFVHEILVRLDGAYFVGAIHLDLQALSKLHNQMAS